jgi:hypothetical protein
MQSSGFHLRVLEKARTSHFGRKNNQGRRSGKWLKAIKAIISVMLRER